MSWFMWLQSHQHTILSLAVTQADTISCTLCFTNFCHPGPYCLHFSWGSWLFQFFLLPSPNHTGLSWLILTGGTWKAWTIPPSIRASQFPKKAGAILRNFRSVRCVRMDKPLWLTYRSSLIYTLCYPPTSPFLKFRKSTTPSVTEALPGIAKAGNEEGGRNRRVHGGKKLLYNQPWHLTRERFTQIKENLYLSLSHVSSLTKTINSI